MLLGYTNWTNVDAGFWRPYQPGDRLVKGWQGAIEVDDKVGATFDEDSAMTSYDPMVLMQHAAEQVWRRHNQDDRPDGTMCPSMSVGDVVQFGEVAFSVDRRGWVRVTVEAADLITDRSWSEVMG